jgi:hypothetical protein
VLLVIVLIAGAVPGAFLLRNKESGAMPDTSESAVQEGDTATSV